MTAPALLTDLPTVTEWRPLPSNAARFLTGEPFGQTIVIHEYYGEHEPRPLLCNKHGIQRHDWNGKEFVCKVCNAQTGRK